MNENSSAEYKTVRGLSRGLLLLNLLNKFDGGATVSTLAEFSGLHRTTVRRLLETLQDEGYVRRSRSDDSFRLTIKVRQLSEGFRDEHWISWLAFAPEHERRPIIDMLAARPEAEYQLAREPEKLAAILERTRQNGYGENFRGWQQEEKIASIAVPVRRRQRVIGCLNLVYMAKAMTIDQAAQKHLASLQKVARQIEERMSDEEVFYQ
ncbi:MAG: helix-turn-helix domain-containing protein [Klebsiella oxytoca]|nr:helix-turn-helix domain-containing protein [Klebsiella oxytoca]